MEIPVYFARVNRRNDALCIPEIEANFSVNWNCTFGFWPATSAGLFDFLPAPRIRESYRLISWACLFFRIANWRRKLNSETSVPSV
jgi:hypothetical protein